MPSRRTRVSASSVTVDEMLSRPASHHVAIHLCRPQRAGQELQRPQRVEEHRRHQRLQVVFAVIYIAEGRVVGGYKHGLSLAQGAAC